MRIKLLSYNIRFGGRERQEKIAQVVNEIEPDVVIFQEATDARVVENLSRACEMRFWGARPKHSLGFISRLETAYSEWHQPRGSHHAFLEIELAQSGARIFGLHLKARFSKWDERRRKREIVALLKSIERHQHGFHALVGDFNTLAPGEAFNFPLMPLWIRALIWLSGRDIQRETIQTVLDAGYVDGFRNLYPEDKGYTFPAWQPHVRLDYIFLPARYADCLKSCEVVKTPAVVAEASDHFPFLSYLEVPAIKET